MVSTIFDGPVSGMYRIVDWEPWQTRTFGNTGQSVLILSNGNGDYTTPNAFHQTETHTSGAVITGKHGADFSWWYATYDQMPTRVHDDWQRVDYLPVPAGLANRFFAASSPDRADTLLPAAVFELADLPGAIYHAGRKLLKPKGPPKFPRKPGVNQAAADWVALNFGWLPLIGDLKNLVNLSELAAKREKEFDKMYSKRGLKRRMNLHSASKQVSFGFAVGAPFWNLTATLSGECVQKIWATCQWVPAGASSGSPLARPTPDYVKRAVLGLNARNITANVWEALPWSWFIDYFFGVQNYLEANSGFYTAVPVKGAMMIHHKTLLTSPPETLVDPFLKVTTLSQGTHVNESKERIAISPESIQARFPVLSVKQLSILGALAVLKAPRL